MTRTKPDLAPTAEQPPKRKLPIGIGTPGGPGEYHEDGDRVAYELAIHDRGMRNVDERSESKRFFKAPGCKPHTVTCKAWNKRGTWEFGIPEVVPIRRSDDILRIECVDEQGKVHRIK